MTIVEDFVALTEKRSKFAPKTKEHMIGSLRRWQRFLAEHDPPIRKDRVDIMDFKEWEEELITDGLSESTIVIYESHIRTFYRLLANAHPKSRYVHLASLMNAHETPTLRTSASPHKPYPLDVCPEILDAAKDCTRAARGYEEIYPVVAGLAYSGMRAQMYGLRVSDLDCDALLINTRTKGGHDVQVPMHECLAVIWKEHLETRTYESDMLFERGIFPYRFLEERKDREVWRDDARSARTNQGNVSRVLGRVEKELKVRGIDEHLTAHRFRKTIGTWGPEFGMSERDMQILLAHSAKNITQLYNVPERQRVGGRWSQIDFWNRKWLDAHDSNGFTVGNGLKGTNDNGNVVEEVRALVNGRVLTAEQRLEIVAVVMEEA